ncbi:hypothetical protein NDO41_16400 [Ectopseudomonas mendocina]|nr:hypothetical protein NDO41_16400 [Pseudomonas mendocina]
MSVFSEISSRLASAMVREKDGLISAAVKQHLGVDTLDLPALVGRLERKSVEGEPGEEFSVDGVPVIWIGDIQMVNVGSELQARFDYRNL